MGCPGTYKKGSKTPFCSVLWPHGKVKKSTHPQPLRKKHPRIFTPSSTVLVEYFTTGSCGILFFRKGVKNPLHSRVNALHRGCFPNHLWDGSGVGYVQGIFWHFLHFLQLQRLKKLLETPFLFKKAEKTFVFSLQDLFPVENVEKVLES